MKFVLKYIRWIKFLEQLKSVAFLLSISIDTYKTNDEQDISNIEFTINDQLFLETLLMIIRGNTIQFSSFNKKKNTEKRKQIRSQYKEIRRRNKFENK